MSTQHDFHRLPVDRTLEEDNWYLQQCFSENVLTQEQIKTLLQRVREGDATAKERLVQAYLPLVATLSTRYLERGLPQEDLLQEGAIGLLQAIEAFDPNREFPFRTFASRRIRWAMHAAIRMNRRWFKVSSVQQAQIDAVNHFTFQLFQEYGSAVLDEETLHQAGLSTQDVYQLELVAEPPLSLDVAYSSSDLDASSDDEWAEPETLLNQLAEPSSWEDHFFQLEEQELLMKALQELPVKEQLVLMGRFGLCGYAEGTLEDVGHMLGVTRERIRQREAKAFRLLRASYRHGCGSPNCAIRSLVRYWREERRTS